MLIGRFAMIVPILAIAGSLAAKRRVAPSPGTFPTTGPIFVGLLVGVVMIVGALNFFPALSLGPIVEQLLLERRTGLLSHDETLMTLDTGRGTRRFQRFVTLGGAKPSGEPPRSRGVLDPSLLRAALPHAFRKLDPRLLARNPVMFVVEITAVLVTVIAIAGAAGVPAPWTPARASASRSRSPRGCGSRSCSRPTPRPSPRPAAAPRPPPCARPAP